MTLATNGLQNAVAYRFVYADATARLAATGFVAADVGALALQQDTNVLYLLTATTPTWQATTGVSAHASTHATGGTDAVALAAGQITSGVFAIGRLATGTPDGTKFVRDDGTLAVPAGSGGTGGSASAYVTAVLADSPLRFWELQETSGTSAADASTNAQAATYVGSYLLGDGNGPIPGSKAARFAGTNSEITQASATATNITGDLTLECWAFLPSVAVFNFLIGKGGGSGATPYALYVDNTGVLTFQVIDSGGTSQLMLATFKALASSWQHIAVTRSGTTVAFYLNGTPINTATQTVTPATNTAVVSLGSRPDHFNYFGGLMAYAAIYGTALSATRIAAHYTAGRG